MEEKLYPIYTDISEFKDYEQNLIEIKEFEDLKRLRLDYPKLASGIFDELENQNFSLELFSMVNGWFNDDFIKDEVYKNAKVKWITEKEFIK